MFLAKIYPNIFKKKKKIEYMPNNEVKSGFLLIFKMFITLLTISNTGNGIVDFVKRRFLCVAL